MTSSGWVGCFVPGMRLRNFKPLTDRSDRVQKNVLLFNWHADSSFQKLNSPQPASQPGSQ